MPDASEAGLRKPLIRVGDRSVRGALGMWLDIYGLCLDDAGLRSLETLRRHGFAPNNDLLNSFMHASLRIVRELADET